MAVSRRTVVDTLHIYLHGSAKQLVEQIFGVRGLRYSTLQISQCASLN